MDFEDDDAFLYGASSPPATAPPSAIPQVTATETPQVKNEVASSSTGVSAAMAASLAAYGIDPSSAVVEETPEDGLVEEEDVEDDDDEESDEDEDDVKLVFTGAGTRLDLRKPQQQQSNVIGIGKWAHTATGVAPPAASPSQAEKTHSSTPAPIPNQTTEYNPQSRPAANAPPSAFNPQISLAGDASASTTMAQTNGAGTAMTTGAPSIHLPPSSLPPVTAAASHPHIDPTNPSGIIPSTGQSVYEIDLNQFETSGQPWRRPGSDLSDWFNFGFDEVSFPKFLRFRAEMEAGRQALMNPMGPMPNNLPSLLHLDMSIPNASMMNGLGRPGQQQMPGNSGMGFTPQQMQQQMMAMGMPGMDGMMGMQNGMGQGQGGLMPQGMGQNSVRQVSQRPSATPAPAVGTPEAGEEVVKQEEGADDASDFAANQDGNVPMPLQGQPGFRGRGMGVPLRGMPTRGVAMRGRGAAVPAGPRGGPPLPNNIPTGPKAGRFRDKDRVDPSSSANSGLDYGGDSRGSSASRSASPIKRSTSGSRRRRERSYSYSDEYDSASDRGRGWSYSHSRSRSRSKSPRDRKDRDRDVKRERVRSESWSKSPSPIPTKGQGQGRERRSTSKIKRDREREKSSGRSGSTTVKAEGGKRKRDRERERERERDEGGSASAVLGPGGWESEEYEERRESRKKREGSEDGKRSRKRR